MSVHNISNTASHGNVRAEMEQEIENLLGQMESADRKGSAVSDDVSDRLGELLEHRFMMDM